MMTGKVKLVDGSTEFFETANYVVSTPDKMHPAILEMTLYNSNGKKIAHWKRPHLKRYVKYEYKPEQVELKPAE